MIPNFPFLGFPSYSRFPRNYYYGKPTVNFKNRPSAYPPREFSNNYTNSTNNNTSNNNTNHNNKNNNCYSNHLETKSKQTNNKVCSDSIEERCSNEYDQFINIFGFKLYFDDILILLILFFLYQEEINDSYLYIILIMLLVS